MSAALRVVVLACCALAALGRAAAAQAPDAHAFVTLAVEPERPVAGQTLVLRLRFGFDARFLADDVVPLFRRALDVPVQVLAAAFDDARLVPLDAPAQGGVTFALGDDVGRARRLPDETRDGRALATFEVARRVLVEQPGELSLGGATLRFAYATRFRDDLVLGRVPDDRHVGEVSSPPLTLAVQPWPAGRPAGFGGAVGRFALEARLDGGPSGVGSDARLTLRVRALDGADVTRFGAPALDGLAAIVHVLGREERLEGDARVFDWDVRLLREDVDALPPLELPCLDPGPPARWVVLRSASLPLRVGPAPDGATPTTARGLDDDVHRWRDPLVDEAPRRASPALAALALGAPWLLFALAVARARRGERERADPLGTRARAAAATFARAASAAPDALHEAFAGYLAARLHRPPAAVVTPHLARLLEEAGVDAALAARAADVLRALVAARYAGGSARAAPGAVDASDAAVRALVDALETRFVAAEGAR